MNKTKLMGSLEYNFVYQDYIDGKHTKKALEREGYTRFAFKDNTINGLMANIQKKMDDLLKDQAVVPIKFSIHIFIS